MTELTINSVCAKGQIYPMIITFQNGYLTEDIEFNCNIEQTEDGKKMISTEIDGILYVGYEENDDLGQTLILARNRISGEVRLIETEYVVLRPAKEIISELDTDKLLNAQKHPETRESKQKYIPDIPRKETDDVEVKDKEITAKILTVEDTISKIITPDRNDCELFVPSTDRADDVQTFDDLIDNDINKYETYIKTKSQDILAKQIFVGALGLKASEEYKRKVNETNVKTGGSNEVGKNVLSCIVRLVHNKANTPTGNAVTDNDEQNVTNDNLKALKNSYVCGNCENIFEDKVALITHLISNKFIKNTESAVTKSKRKRKTADNSNLRRRKCTNEYKDLNSRNKRETIKKINNTSTENCSESKDDSIFAREKESGILEETDAIDAEDKLTETAQVNLEPMPMQKDNVSNKMLIKNGCINSKEDCKIEIKYYDSKETKLLLEIYKEDLTDSETIKTFICDHCKRVFEKKAWLTTHIAAHQAKRNTNIINKPTCSTCNRQFAKKSDLINHEIDEHNTNIKHFSCPICDFKTTTSIYKLTLHMRTHDPIGLWSCDSCEYETNYKSNLLKHKLTHTDMKPYECPICEGKFRQYTHLKQHFKRHNHNERKKTSKIEAPLNTCSCNYCGRSFKSKELLIPHIKSHSEDVSAEPNKNPKTVKNLCSKCNTTFVTKSELINHEIKIHNSTIKYKSCMLCEFKTTYTYRLTIHNQMHLNIKPFKCTICSYACQKSSDLKVHNRSHTGYKPFQCNICESKFARKNDLKRHFNIHTGDRQYKCTKCESQFKHRSGLKRHLTVHAVEGHYKCTTCSYITKYLPALNRHKRFHIGEKSYKCTQCEYSCTRGYDLKRHTKAKHALKPEIG